MEFVKNRLLMRVVDTGTGVGNRYKRKTVWRRFVRHSGTCGIRHTRIFADASRMNADRAAFAGEPNGVFQKIREQLNHSVWIAIDDQGFPLDIRQKAQ